MKFLFFCAIAMTIPTLSGSESLTLVRDGKPESEIIVGSKPVSAAQFAALELQHIVKLITGAELEIKAIPSDGKKVGIYVGESEEARKLGFPGKPFDREEYLVDFKGNNIILMGNDRPDFRKVDYSNFATFPGINFYYRSTTYAVYDFIEDAMNVRFYAPGDEGTTCRKRSTLEVKPFQRRRHPGMDAFRRIASYQIEPGRARDYSLLFLRWRLNSMYGVANHSVYGIFWRYWGKAKSPHLAKLFIEKRPEYFASGYSGRLASIGSEYPDDPELPPQLCLSHPGTLAYFTWEAAEQSAGRVVPGGYAWMPGMKGQPYYYNFQEDDNSYHCKCPECTAFLSKNPYSEMHFDFVNRLAESIDKKAPGTGVATLAYNDSMGMPKKELHPAVAVMMCLSIQSWYHPGTYAFQFGKYSEWVRKEGKKRPLMIWTYMLCPAHEARIIYRYNKFFPFLYPWKTAEYFKTFTRDGIRGWFGETNLQQHMLETYIAARITYDPSVDTDKLIDEYFDLYYGRAGKDMKAFYSELENICWNPDNMPEVSKKSPITGSFVYGYHTEKRNWHYGTAERMASLQKHMDNALKSASTPEEKARVKRFVDLIWGQAVEGRKEFEFRENARKAPIPATTVPYLKEYDGNAEKVHFESLKPLESWSTLEGEKTDWKPDIRLGMDAKYLYLSYVEKNTPAIARNDASLWSNDIEIFLAKRIGSDFLQIAVAPDGKTEVYSSRIINGALHLRKLPDPVKIASRRQDSKWEVKMAIPFKAVPGFGPAIKAGDTIFGNIFRTDTRKQVNKSCAWSPIFTVDYREGLFRMGPIHLTLPSAKGEIDVNGRFTSISGSPVPNEWYELKKADETDTISTKDGIVKFGGDKTSLMRHRYLLSRKIFQCKEGDTITLTFKAKGSGGFASGIYFYYDMRKGSSNLVTHALNPMSKDKFEEMTVRYTVKDPAKEQVVSHFRLMFYAFPEARLEISDLAATVEPKE
ncbi:MAG: hypothetical protein BWY31_03509 [Lentisphaerae bacterium ADurb.Bin242]|nr:MAG: hypothetical protein BWY31_03509 [Lentisphaerae bacterium ADurb.Bin242]